MFRRSALAALPLLAAVSCGYVGPVVPPSTRIPTAVSDLKVAERGDQLEIDFTTPPRTTDNLPIQKFEAIELRVTPKSGAARSYPLPLPPAQSSKEVRVTPIHDTIPAADWAGRSIVLQVRSAAKSGDHYSGWSNAVEFDVVRPLATPSLEVEATAAGYRLAWAPSPSNEEHRVLRLGPGAAVPVEVASVPGSGFTDKSAQWSTAYAYTVVAVEGSAESLPSNPVNVNVPDTFPPSIPTNVTALASPDGIELSWERSPESDVAGYYVYRATGVSSFTRVDGLSSLPVFSDKNVEHGKKYAYRVSAVDTSGNESERSAAAEVEAP